MANPVRKVSSDQALTPVPDIFLALAGELERARALGLRVESAICALAVRSAIDADVVSELQQFDVILQHIAALRDYATEIALRIDPSHNVAAASALDRITLDDVRTRLAGGDQSDGSQEIWEFY
jgi:hypothetical protein